MKYNRNIGRLLTTGFAGPALLLPLLCACLLLAAPVWAEETAPDEASALAEPERELNLPSIPDMQPVASLDGPSTEEANDAFLRDDSQWKDIKTFEREAKREAKEVEKSNTQTLHIRYALLPDRRAAVVLATPRPAAAPQTGGMDLPVATDKPAAKEKKPEASAEACQALATMRRKQLEAIESDRKTLSELRAALADLGLTSKLGYMAETGESVSSNETDPAKTPGKMVPTKIQ